MTPEQVISALRRQFNATGRVPTLREWFDVDPTNRWWEQYDLIPGKVYFFESGRGFGWFPYKLAGKPYPGYEGPYVAGGYPGDGPYTGPWYGPYSPEPVIPPYAVVGNPNIHYTGDQKWSYPGYRNADPDGSPEWFSEHQLESQLRAMRQQPRKIEQWLSVIDPRYLEGGEVPEVPEVPELPPEIVEPPEPEVVEVPPTEPPWGAPDGAPDPGPQVEPPEELPSDPPAEPPQEPPNHTWAVVEELWKLLCGDGSLTIEIKVKKGE